MPSESLGLSLLDPRLAHCRRIFVRQFALPVSIGFLPEEQLAKQRVIFDVDVFVPLAITKPNQDQASEVIDYDFIRRRIIELAQSRHFNLQETLLDAITSALLAKRGVVAVRVATQKPDIYPGEMTVGIETFCFNAVTP
jgi:7,8-dihydroneopterin aldolase/epimerase/oxygenase